MFLSKILAISSWLTEQRFEQPSKNPHVSFSLKTIVNRIGLKKELISGFELPNDFYPENTTVRDCFDVIKRDLLAFLTFVDQHGNKEVKSKFMLCDSLTDKSSWDYVFLECFFNTVFNLFGAKSDNYYEKIESRDEFESDIEWVFCNLNTLSFYKDFYQSDMVGGKPENQLESILDDVFHNQSMSLESKMQNFQNIFNMVRSKKIPLPSMWEKIVENYFEWKGRNQMACDLFDKPGELEKFIYCGDKPELQIYKAFVDHVIEGLSSKKSVLYIAFLAEYFPMKTALQVIKQHREYWLESLNTHMRNNPFNSEDFIKCYVGVLRFGLKDVYLSQSDEGRDSMIEKILAFFEDEGTEIKNKQIERYRVEIALVFFDTIGNELVNRGGDPKASGMLSKELSLFLDIIQYTKCMYFLVFDLGSDVFFPKKGSLRYLSETCKNDILNLALGSDRQRRKHSKEALEVRNYDNKWRSDFAGFHFWVREFSEDFALNIKRNWHKVFWAFYDHIQKRGPKDIEISDVFKESVENLLTKYNNFYDTLNPGGLLTDRLSANSFFEKVIEYSVYEINSARNDVNMSAIANLVSGHILGVHRILERYKPFGIEEISYQDISDQHIQIMMEYGDSCYQELDKFVNRFSKTFSEKIEVSCECLRTLSPRLNVEFEDNQIHLNMLRNNSEKSRVFLDRLAAKVITSKGSRIHTVEVGLTELIKHEFESSLQDIPDGDKKSFLAVIYNLDSVIERMVAECKYLLADMCRAYKGLIPEGFAQKESLDRSALQSLKEFSEELSTKFSPVFDRSSGVLPKGIEYFQNNQTLALFLVKRYLDDVRNNSPRFMKLGTGQGKTLIQATTALLSLGALSLSGREGVNSNSVNKVIIFTSFKHLAKRDHAAMDKLFKHFTIESLCLNELRDCGRITENTKQVFFVDSEAFEHNINYAARSPNESVNKDFLKFVYGDWSNYLVILDEFDVLLDKSELFCAYDVYHNFSSHLGSRLKHELQDGIFSDIAYKTGHVRNFEDYSSNDSRVTNQSGNSLGLVAGLGRQLKEHKLFLFPTVFSLKAKLNTCNKVIGFSGTVDQEKVDSYMSTIFSEKEQENPHEEKQKNPLLKIPLFFSPYVQFSEGVVCRNVYAEKATQLNWVDQAVREGEICKMPDLIQKPLWTESSWIDAIRRDIQLAQDNQQPVVIFVAEAKLETLEKALGIPIGYVFKEDEHAQDANLQRIAYKGHVALCTKKIGRGADIRVPSSIQNGLHIIIASIDYKYEILQQIGRTGRMNRKGSFSIILCATDCCPTYKEDTKEYIQKKADSEFLSAYFYTERRANFSKEAHAQFIWLLDSFYMRKCSLSVFSPQGSREEQKDAARKFLESLPLQWWF